ncbi:MAG: Sua5/YciO/YrdC/YwlC family protein, partial [Nitrospira sp.]|nr:Sua5/YciO/YrdC/YwlC family protein [Nitrospira sp.]
DPRVCELLTRGGPLTGSSATRTGQRPAQSATDVQDQLGPDIDLILDGGSTPGGQPSTVLQVEPEVRILREGAISPRKLQEFLASEGNHFF